MARRVLVSSAIGFVILLQTALVPLGTSPPSTPNPQFDFQGNWGGAWPATFRATYDGSTYYLRASILDDPREPYAYVTTETWSDTIDTITVQYGYERVTRERSDGTGIHYWAWVNGLDSAIEFADGVATLSSTSGTSLDYVVDTGRAAGSILVFDLAGNLQSLTGTLDGKPYALTREYPLPPPPGEDLAPPLVRTVEPDTLAMGCRWPSQWTGRNDMLGLHTVKASASCSLAMHEIHGECVADPDTTLRVTSRWNQNSIHAGSAANVLWLQAQVTLNGMLWASPGNGPELFGAAEASVRGYVRVQIDDSHGNSEFRERVISGSGNQFGGSFWNLLGTFPVPAWTDWHPHATFMSEARLKCIGAPNAYALWRGNSGNPGDPFAVKLESLHSAAIGSDCRANGDAGDGWGDTTHLILSISCQGATSSTDDPEDWYSFFLPAGTLNAEFGGSDRLCFRFFTPTGAVIVLSGSAPSGCISPGWTAPVPIETAGTYRLQVVQESEDWSPVFYTLNLQRT